MKKTLVAPSSKSDIFFTLDYLIIDFNLSFSNSYFVFVDSSIFDFMIWDTFIKLI